VKILQVNTLYPPAIVGGAELTAESISKNLTQRGIEVCVATLSEEKIGVADSPAGYTIYRYPLRNFFWPFDGFKRGVLKRFAWHLRDRKNATMGKVFGELLDKEKPTHVLTHNLQGWSCSVWDEATKRGVRVVHMLHDHQLVCPKTTRFKAGKNCQELCINCRVLSLKRIRGAQRINGLISVSQSLLDSHLDLGVFSPSLPSVVIYNSLRINIQRIAQPRQAFSWSKSRRNGSPIRIGYLGRIEKVKGIEVLLSAFFNLVFVLDEYQFELKLAGVGHDGYVAGLQQKFNAGNSGVNVQYLGRQDAQTFLDSVDILVVPSLMSEGLGNVAFEAMARGALTIASNCGGLTEVLGDGQFGILVPPSDVLALTKALSEAIQNPSLSHSIASKGWSRSADFSSERQSEQIVNFLKLIK
jgi:glycosyltransferase involved in cell wall biosynthesis